jgi:NADH:ubiquinone oxidoreductase subunit 2 (subunit N)
VNFIRSHFILDTYSFTIIFSEEYGISLTLLNVVLYVWLLLAIFGIIFLFDIKFFKTLNDLKNFWSLFFISILLILNLLSMAGIPPMAGFVGKFLLFLFLLFKHNFFVAFLFTFVNFFVMYFYIQNLRFVISKTPSNFFFLKNCYIYLDFNLIFILIFLGFFNFFGLLFFNDFLIFFINLANFIFLE